MNERIKELAEQSIPFDENGQKVRGLNSEYHDQWMEKFAELIVKECAHVVFKKTGPKSALDVLGHFGVEE